MDGQGVVMVSFSESKILPLATKQLISQLNELFVEFVGPIGQELSEDVFAQWVLGGKYGPAAIRHYAQALSKQIDSMSERQVFMQKAEKLLLK